VAEDRKGGRESQGEREDTESSEIRHQNPESRIADARRWNHGFTRMHTDPEFTTKAQRHEGWPQPRTGRVGVGKRPAADGNPPPG
jgi:hypothetical protein